MWNLWTRRFLILAAVVASVVVMPSRPALACSCAPGDPVTDLDDAPAAFIGTVVDVSPAENPREFQEVVFTFEVDEWVKGDLGAVIEMRSSESGASCGFEMRPGQSSGVYIRHISTELSGGLCDRVDGDLLRAAATGVPAPTGSGPIAFIVPGSFGGAGLIALDAGGAILGYGRPAVQDGFYFPDISVCPGSERMVELIPDDRVVVRDLASLAIVDDIIVGALPSDSEFTYFTAVACRSRSADEIFVFGVSDTFVDEEHFDGGEVSPEDYYASQKGVVYELASDGFRLVAETGFTGDGGRPAIAGNIAVEVGSYGTGELRAFDLDTGESRVLHRYAVVAGSDEPRYVEGLGLSPSGRFVAAMDATLEGDGVDYFLSIFDTEAEKPLVARTKMTESGAVVWIDEETVAYVLNYHLHDEDGEETPGAESGTVQLFRASDLTLIGEWGPWTAGDVVAVDGLLYGVSPSSGKLISAPALSGPMTELSSLPGSVRGIVAVFEGPGIDPVATAVPQRSASSTPPATGLPAPGAEVTGNDGSRTPAGFFGDDDPGPGAPPLIVLIGGPILLIVAAVVAVLWARRRRPTRP